MHGVVQDEARPSCRQLGRHEPTVLLGSLPQEERMRTIAIGDFSAFTSPRHPRPEFQPLKAQ